MAFLFQLGSRPVFLRSWEQKIVSTKAVLRYNHLLPIPSTVNPSLCSLMSIKKLTLREISAITRAERAREIRSKMKNY